MTAATPQTTATAAAQQGVSFKAVVWLSAPQITATMLISAGAAYESFFAFRGLALLFGWDPDHAWMVMPLVELFLVVGALEEALRQLIGTNKRMLRAPRAVSYAALLITLAVNIGYRVLTLILPVVDDKLVPGVTLPFHWWQVIMIGAFASIIPLAQLLSLHFLAGTLRRLAEFRTRDRSAAATAPDQPRKGIGSLARRLVEQKLEAKLEQAAERSASAGQTPPRADLTDPTVTAQDGSASGDPSARRADDDTARDGSASGEPRARRAEGDTARQTDRSTDRRDASGDRHRTDRRSRSADPDRSATGASARDEASGDRSPQVSREEGYRSYADGVDKGNGEPTDSTIAAAIGVSTSRARNVRAEWRSRYAAEVAAGTRRPLGELPPPIAKVLADARVDSAASEPAERSAVGPANGPAAGGEPAAVEQTSPARQLRVVPPAVSGAGDDLDVALDDREPAAATA